MARISVPASAISSIGKLIGEASIDPAKGAAFKRDPRQALIDAGVPASSLDGLTVAVHEDTATTINFIVPFEADKDKIESGEESYLEELGQVAVLGCHFDVT
jgi:hypothetical protein